MRAFWSAVIAGVLTSNCAVRPAALTSETIAAPLSSFAFRQLLQPRDRGKLVPSHEDLFDRRSVLLKPFAHRGTDLVAVNTVGIYNDNADIIDQLEPGERCFEKRRLA